MVLPKQFWVQYRKKIWKSISLRRLSGEEWPVRVWSDQKLMLISAGWKLFSIENALEVGDEITFTVVSPTCFLVQICDHKSGHEKTIPTTTTNSIHNRNRSLSFTHSHLHCHQHGAFFTTKIAPHQQQQQQQYEKEMELTPNLLHQCHTLKDNNQQLCCSPTIEQLKQPLLLPIKDCSATAAAAITTTPNKQMGLLPNNNLQKPTPPLNNSKALLHREVLTSNGQLLVLLDSDSEKDEKELLTSSSPPPFATM